MTIGEIVRRERQAKGLSMRALAKKADVALATIQNTEHDKHEPTSSTLRSIAEALDIKASDIMLEVVSDTVKQLDEKRGGVSYG